MQKVIQTIKNVLTFLEYHRAKVVLIAHTIVVYLVAHPVAASAHPKIASLVAVAIWALGQTIAVYKYLDGNAKDAVASYYNPTPPYVPPTPPIK